MSKAHSPRHGSMQFWPRVKAQSARARVRSWNLSSGSKVVGFAGYKVGMTHVIYKDEDKHSPTKGDRVSVPVTVIECPPLKVMGVRAYKQDVQGKVVVSDFKSGKLDKHLDRRIAVPKKTSDAAKLLDSFDVSGCDELVLVVHTQPSATGIGKKKPDVFELPIGGSVEEQFSYAKEMLGKEIAVSDVFGVGDVVDVHGVTKGKGFQGPVKRFGVNLRSHKSEKVRRGPGSLGGWKSQAHVMYRVAHAGQMGYHRRTTYNLPVYHISDDPATVNAAGGFIRYGLVKNTYILIKGSVHGPNKRLVSITKAIRATRKHTAPSLQYISTVSKQGRCVNVDAVGGQS